MEIFDEINRNSAAAYEAAQREEVSRRRAAEYQRRKAHAEEMERSMPRIRQYEDKYRSEDFRKAIEVGKALSGIKYDKDVAAEIDMTPSALCTRLKNLDTFSLNEFRKLIRALNLNPYDVLKFLGYTNQNIKEWMER